MRAQKTSKHGRTPDQGIRHLVSYGSATVLILVVAAWYWNTEQDAWNNLPAAGVLSSSTETEVGTPSLAMVQPLATASNASAPISIDPRKPVSFDQLNQDELLYLSKDLKRFKFLIDKALLSESEKQELADLSQQDEFLQQAMDRILKFDPEEQQALARRSRIVAISSLFFAAERGAPSIRDRVLDLAEDAVLRDVIRSEWPKDIRKGFVGDKLELMMLLNKYDPERLTKLSEKSMSPATRKILEYAYTEIAKTKTDKKGDDKGIVTDIPI